MIRNVWAFSKKNLLDKRNFLRNGGLIRLEDGQRPVQSSATVVVRPSKSELAIVSASWKTRSAQVAFAPSPCRSRMVNLRAAFGRLIGMMN